MVKKLTILAITGLLAYSVQAQTTKGTLVLTGELGYTQSKSETDKEKNSPLYEYEHYNYFVSPSIGFLIKDNLEIGATAHRYKSANENIRYMEGFKSTWKLSQKTTGASVYARQYKYLTEKLALHGTLSVGVSNQEYHDISSNSDAPYSYHFLYEFDATTLNGSFSPGLTFFASNKIGFTASLGALTYNRVTTDAAREHSDYYYSPDEFERREYTLKRNVLLFDFSSLHLNFGISYFLGK
ncbi:hypothetical protein [Pontibacter virosus]|uniref:Outer membrane protein with beta-barrel domain n=1 Tax=Pontibacter virosus TaxID=1765052 RepID=A0A2U1AT32_9BACT|nr:hypothetical protein [Pontibacter virosus]PVY39427.1 hypothetical protein C8E01_11134 [Pontibacter virosus]